MKYEMFFGDDGLFFDAQKDCEMVGNGHHKVENGKLMVWNFTEKRWCNSHTNTITISAMRRVIAEPKRWTVEDQKAGRLPDVGAKYISGDTEFTCHYIDKSGDVWGHTKNDVVWCRSICEIIPIETPEEKSARLREEWCIKALSSCSILSGMQKYELKRLGGYIEDIYDALLSGDLPVPGKE